MYEMEVDRHVAKIEDTRNTSTGLANTKAVLKDLGPWHFSIIKIIVIKISELFLSDN